jgi:large subunit ribosomal protein L6
MSKIGRKSIDISGVNVEVKDKDIHFSGPLNKGVYRLDEVLKAKINDSSLSITLVEGAKKVARGRVLNRIWGMHRALLANEVIGAKVGFSKKIIITGLGYKAVMSGKKVVFTLGYSQKIKLELTE